jgi:hypothetical protein
VNVAVGQQTDEVQDIVPAEPRRQFSPGFAIVNRTGFNRVLNQQRTLVEHTPGTDRVVTDLAVTHVVVRGHTNGRPVSLQLGEHGVLL